MAEIRFNVTIDDEDGMLWAKVKQLPGCFASGIDIDELKEALFEAVQMCLPDGVKLINPRLVLNSELRPASAMADDLLPRQVPREMLICA